MPELGPGGIADTEKSGTDARRKPIPLDVGSEGRMEQHDELK